MSGELAGAVERLDEITRRLRVECPWDRDQDARSIVPHTVEEAYELADAAHSGDDAKMLDELGDVLFQVVFLSLLLEERDAGDLAQVAEQCRQKLIRRHPHVFGEVEADTAVEVLHNWDTIKAETEGGGLFGDLPETLPATLYAKKAQRRAARAEAQDAPAPGVAESAAALDGAEDRDERFEAAGELLFAAVAAADRYIARIQEGPKNT